MTWLIAYAIGAVVTVGLITVQHYRRYAPGDQVAFWLTTLVTLLVALIAWPWMLWVAIGDMQRYCKPQRPEQRKFR
jgi:hypothetical protein